MHNFKVADEQNKMTKGSHLWAKGVSGNPAGRPKVSPELRVKFAKFREKTLETLIRFGNYDVKQINRIADDVNSNCIEAVVARTYAKAIEGSDRHSRELFDRILGPIIQTLVVAEAHEGQAKTLDPEAIYQALIKVKQEPKEEPCKLIENLSQPFTESSQE